MKNILKATLTVALGVVFGTFFGIWIGNLAIQGLSVLDYLGIGVIVLMTSVLVWAAAVQLSLVD